VTTQQWAAKKSTSKTGATTQSLSKERAPICKRVINSPPPRNARAAGAQNALTQTLGGHPGPLSCHRATPTICDRETSRDDPTCAGTQSSMRVGRIRANGPPPNPALIPKRYSRGRPRVIRRAFVCVFVETCYARNVFRLQFVFNFVSQIWLTTSD